MGTGYSFSEGIAAFFLFRVQDISLLGAMNAHRFIP